MNMRRQHMTTNATTPDAMRMARVLIGIAMVAVLASGSLARAADEPTYENPESATIATSVDAELAQLEWALGAPFVEDPQFVESRQGLLACVADQLRGSGLPAGTVADVRVSTIDTLKQCAEKLGATLPEGGVDRYFGLAGLGATPPGAHAPPCKPSAGDPTIGAGSRKDFTPAEWKQIKETYQKREDDAVKAATDAIAKADALERESEKVKNDPKATDEQKAKAEADMRKAQKDAAEKAKKASEAIKENEVIKNTDPEQKGPAPLVSQTLPEFGNTCAAVAEQLAECERTNWASSSCQRIKAAAQGCTFVDPNVTDPVPTADDGGDAQTSRCPLAEPSEMERAAAIIKGCEALVNYGPDGGSPCSVTIGSATVAEEFYCVPYNGAMTCHSGGGNPCGGSETTPDPSGEPCAGTVTLISVRRSAGDLIAAAFPKLGGPVWTPAPPPPPGPGGPERGSGNP